VSDYTPTTDEVRDSWADMRAEDIQQVVLAFAEFDLRAVEGRVRPLARQTGADPMSGHRHKASAWDGHYETCRCGASAGDKHNPHTGLRCTTFAEWEDR
jgi:hypothetical protein